MGCMEELRRYHMVLAALIGLALGQNLDTRWPVVRTGPDGGMFGYSVALHREGSINWLLVGAPKAQTTQQDVVEGGAVYKCPVFPLSERDTCQQVPFDTTGHTVDSSGGQVADKSFQFFGATVKSSGPDGRVMACAPRYTWFYTAEMKDDERAPVGTCYISANNFTSFTEYSPCMTDDMKLWSFKKITHCQAGFSGEIAEDNSLALIGAVGSYFLQGQIYVQSLVSAEEPLSTDELDPVYDDSYSGFSVAIGEFTGDNQPDYAVGAPRGNSLRGRVTIFDTVLDTLTVLSGEQIASYFGHTMVVEDVNGDGLDDVIVGAPMFADKKPSIDKWEAGRVYIFYQNQDHSFSEPSTITGQMTRARLGTAIASLGDVNQDGFNDIAIGAPYQGENQTGVVSIHLGSPDGLRLTSSQVLTPADFGLNDATTFGFSLSGGLDMDDNNYPDLLIGAQESNLAVLARARPVILLNAFLSITPEGINLDNKTHQLPDGSHATSFEITYCFTYQGKHLPDSAKIQYTLSLDTLQMVSPRALFAIGMAQGTNRRTSKMTLTKNMEYCSVSLAYVRMGIRDKLRPISVNLEYALNENAVFQPYELQPFLNSDTSSLKTKQVYINNNCKDNVCIPDLELKASVSTTELRIGGSDTVTMNVVVTNKGDDAFLAMLKVVVPQGLQFVRVVRKQADFSVTCSNDKQADTLICDIGNPLMHNYKVDFGLKFSSFQLSGDKSSVVFALSATSANLEASAETMTNNYANFTMGVKARVDLGLLGRSIPAQVAYTPEGTINPAITKDSEAGPLVVHVYEVSNSGPSNAGLISLDISWPMVDENGNYLLYLIGVEPSAGTTCQGLSAVNPLNLTLEESQLSNVTFGSNGDTYSSSKRRRRQAEQSLPQVGSVDCSSSICITISCSIQELKGGESEVIKFWARLWNNSFVETTFDRYVIASTGKATVRNLPYKIKPSELPQVKMEVSTIVSPDEPVVKRVPIWVIILAVLGGLLLLLLVIFLLYKLGFFKRKKYQKVNADEKRADL